MDYRLLSNNNNTYPTHHHWFPKMCSCVGNTGSSYAPNTRSHRSTNFFHGFNQMMRHPDHLSIDSERNAIIKFHNSDTEPSVLTVEKDLRIIDLCELLKVKHQKHGSRWTIIEKWIDIGIERTLEDHEDILEVYKEGEMLLPIHGRRFDFDVNYNRYEYFDKPENYFPSEMVVSGEERINSFMTTVENALRVCVSRIDEELPKICSEAWVLNKNTNGYVKCRLLLEDRKLYTMPLADSPLYKYSSLTTQFTTFYLDYSISVDYYSRSLNHFSFFVVPGLRSHEFIFLFFITSLSSRILPSLRYLGCHLSLVGVLGAGNDKRCSLRAEEVFTNFYKMAVRYTEKPINVSRGKLREILMEDKVERLERGLPIHDAAEIQIRVQQASAAVPDTGSGDAGTGVGEAHRGRGARGHGRRRGRGGRGRGRGGRSARGRGGEGARGRGDGGNRGRGRGRGDWHGGREEGGNREDDGRGGRGRGTAEWRLNPFARPQPTYVETVETVTRQYY